MHSVSVMEVLKQQYTSCMKVGTGRNLVENTIRNYLGLGFTHGVIVLKLTLSNTTHIIPL